MYFNTLIIMNEDALGYGNRSRKPSGYCKLTMPNRVSCYVQGLRQLSEGQIYKLYLTSKSRQKSVEVGMLQVGVSGNKETRWVMDPTSINNSGINAEEIDGAFIIITGDDISGNVVPLIGFSSEPYIWEHLVQTTKEIPPTEVKVKAEVPPTEVKVKAEVPLTEVKVKAEVPPTEVKVKVEETVETVQLADSSAESNEPIKLANGPWETNPMREYTTPIFSDQYSDAESYQESSQEPNVDQTKLDEVLALKEEVIKLNQTIQESKAIIEALQRQTVRTQEVGEPQSQNIKPPGAGSRNFEQVNPMPTYMEPLEKVSGINDYINNFIRKFQATEKEDQSDPRYNRKDNCLKVGEIFEKRIPISPFEAQNTGIKWVRITHEDLVSLPMLSHEWTNQTLMMDAHRDYKHFILGRDEVGLTYYVGIPGVFDPSKESALNIDKIERFSCCHNVPPKAGEAGYWIARM